MDFEEILTRGVSTIIPNRKDLQKLLESKKIRVYFGIDPTATKIHLGHAVSLRKLKVLSDLGHEVIFLIGDFTAKIGDTSDKEAERPALTDKEIKENFATYKKQASKILDFNKVKVVFNSEWLKDLTFGKILELSHYFSANDFVGRELIRKRLNEGKRIGLQEVLYPLAQGYDFYKVDADLQIGGADQIFNMQAGRTLQKALRNKETFVLSTQYLEGPDGRKMSKSWGNAIWLEDTPDDMFAKVLSINDEQIEQYFLLATNLSAEEIKKILSNENNLTKKKKLAHEIVKELYDEKLANEAQENFEKRVQKKEIPEEIQTLEINAGNSIADILLTSKIIESKSEIKRLTEQNGIRLNENVVKDLNIKAEEGIIQIGKRRFLRIKLKK